jgi:hypothetical protein
MHAVKQQSVASVPSTPADGKNNVGHLLDALQCELSALAQRRSEIGRRIRILDRTLRGLRAGVGQAASHNP